VQKTLQPALAARLKTALGATGWKLEVDPDMPDGQCLLLPEADESITPVQAPSLPVLNGLATAA